MFAGKIAGVPSSFTNSKAIDLTLTEDARQENRELNQQYTQLQQLNQLNQFPKLTILSHKFNHILDPFRDTKSVRLRPEPCSRRIRPAAGRCPQNGDSAGDIILLKINTNYF